MEAGWAVCFLWFGLLLVKGVGLFVFLTRLPGISAVDEGTGGDGAMEVMLVGDEREIAWGRKRFVGLS